MGANSFAKQAEGLPVEFDGAAARPLANEFAPTGEELAPGQTVLAIRLASRAQANSRPQRITSGQARHCR
ncbi:hypothetical protein E8F12_06515 [Pseudomonas sp. BN102]|nr:hypothetical protein [Pseudomonas sp. BN102]